MKIYKKVSALFVLLLFIILIFDSRLVVESASDGVDLCMKSVIPSLFPFMFFSNLLVSMLRGENGLIISWLEKLFSMPTGTGSILIPAFLGGYPAGAHSISVLYKSGQLSESESGKLMAFCNNAGPAFIFGILSSCFYEQKMLWILWIIQIAGALATSMLFSEKRTVSKIKSSTIPRNTDILQAAIFSMARICGWVILFRVILSFENRLWGNNIDHTLLVLLSGLTELTNGCSMLGSIANEKVRFCLANVFLSSGGLCVVMQVKTIARNISLKYFLSGKAIHLVMTSVLCISYLTNPVLFFFFMLVMPLIPLPFRKKTMAISSES